MLRVRRMYCFSSPSSFLSSGPEDEGTSFLQNVTTTYQLMQQHHIQEGQNLQSLYLHSLFINCHFLNYFQQWCYIGVWVDIFRYRTVLLVLLLSVEASD